MRKFRFILRQAQDEVERFQRVSLMVSLSNHGPHRFSASRSSTLESVNPRLCYACFAGAV